MKEHNIQELAPGKRGTSKDYPLTTADEQRFNYSAEFSRVDSNQNSALASRINK